MNIGKLSTSTDTWDRLEAYVTSLMSEKKVPGVAVGVLHDGKTQTIGAGVTNVDHPLPVTDETLFQIGSITKTFTGTLIMVLAERGEVDLQASIRTYLPDFQVADTEASARATVHHLLTHRSGWDGDFFHDTGAGDDALKRYVADMIGLGQLAPIDTVWSYNNAGFAVLGRIIEEVTAKPYHVALQEMVLEPLGLHSSYFDPGDVITHRFAVGHSIGKDGPAVARPWPLGRYAWPMGGIVCHVSDLLRYAQFHLGNGRTETGNPLLTEATVREMQTPQAQRWRSHEQFGLTWFIDEIDGARQLSHGGSTTGQASLLALIPEHNLAVAVLTNGEKGGQLAGRVKRWVLREVLGLEEPEPEPVNTPVEDLGHFVGRYSRPSADVELSLVDGTLTGQLTFKKGFPNEETPPPPAPPPFSLSLCEPDQLLIVDGPLKGSTLAIIRKPDRSIGWLGGAFRIHLREE